jgi:hypothetical protein
MATDVDYSAFAIGLIHGRVPHFSLLFEKWDVTRADTILFLILGSRRSNLHLQRFPAEKHEKCATRPWSSQNMSRPPLDFVRIRA